MPRDISEILETNKDEVLKYYGLTDKRVAEDVQMIKEWMKQQPHFPPPEEDRRIEGHLLSCKFSTERVKRKLDMYYSLRRMIPEILSNRDPLNKELFEHLNKLAYIPLPKLTENYERISVVKLSNKYSDDFEPYQLYKIGFMLLEILIQRDYCVGEHIIFDLNGIKLSHTAKFTPTHLKKLLLALTQAYSFKLNSCHFINTPFVADAGINIFKALMKPKIAARVHVHREQESVLKLFPKRCIPEDYGGTEKSTSELTEIWKNELIAWRAWFQKEEDRVTDESKRPEKFKYEDSFGSINGSFRKLEVD